MVSCQPWKLEAVYLAELTPICASQSASTAVLPCAGVAQHSMVWRGTVQHGMAEKSTACSNMSMGCNANVEELDRSVYILQSSDR